MSITFKESLQSEIPKDNLSLHSEYQETVSKNDIGFQKLVSRTDYLEQSTELAKKYNDRKNFYHFGVGGSALGPKMMIQALQRNEKEFNFIDNIDSDSIHKILETINFNESVLFFVSKSGSTAETLALLSIVINKFSDKEFKNSIVIATENKSSALKDFQQIHALDFLEIPFDVGGRFCALSNIGLFPLAFAGADCQKLLEGAKHCQQELLETKVTAHAQAIFSLYENGINETVLMPYSDKLNFFGDWFIQLWAESLGKDAKGPTPIKAIGATDQHSALQLFTQGPNNKCFLTIEVDQRVQDLVLKTDENHEAFKKLAPFTLNQLLKAEYEGTTKSLITAKKNLIEIKISELDEHALGCLVLYFEALTVMMGLLLKVNPFNQPGVEDSKKFAWEWLNSRRN